MHLFTLAKKAVANPLACAVMALMLTPGLAACQSTQDQVADAAQSNDHMCLFGRVCSTSTGDQPKRLPSTSEAPALSAYKENYFDLVVKNLGPQSVSPWVFKLGIKTPLYVGRDFHNGLYLGYRMTGYWDINA